LIFSFHGVSNSSHGGEIETMSLACSFYSAELPVSRLVEMNSRVKILTRHATSGQLAVVLQGEE
jgi:hypothetical protein